VFSLLLFASDDTPEEPRGIRQSPAASSGQTLDAAVGQRQACVITADSPRSFFRVAPNE